MISTEAGIAIATTSSLRRNRGLIPSLVSPHPLIDHLPGLFQDDDFSRRFVSAFDAALAPIIASLDNFTAYIDPWLAPEDFLEWLAGWFGIVLDDSWTLARRRALVARAFEFYRMRGTPAGLQAQVELLTGGSVELHETGGIASSTTAGAALPGSPNFAVLVRVTVDDPGTISLSRLDALVAAAKPAHVTHKVELVKRSEVKEAVEVTSE
jgi:phage tail-like protein